MTEPLLVLPLALLAGALLFLPVVSRALHRDAGWFLALIMGAGTAVTCWLGGLGPLRGEALSYTVHWMPAWKLSFALRLDALSWFFMLLAFGVGTLVFIYSTRYFAPGRITSFYVIMTGFALAMVALILSDDLILLFVSWELTSLASAFLVARSGRAGEPAALRTLILTFTGGIALVIALGLIVMRTGTTTLSASLASDIWTTDGTFTAVVAVLVALAAFSKSAQFPFHPWLPDAMAAETPVSAYLHAAAVVKAGIYLLLRFSPAFRETPAWNVLLITVGLGTAVMAGLFALQKTDLKKLMAYSTVSQLGWIVATIGVGTEWALIAAVLHTFAHALFKSGLFLSVGLIDHAAGTRDIRRLPVLYRAMPWTCATTILGASGMAGIPPLLGFASKEGMLTALAESFHSTEAATAATWLVLLVATLGAVLTVAYCFRIVLGGFFDGRGAPSDRGDIHLHANPPQLFIPAALATTAGLPLAFLLPLLSPLAGAIGAAAARPVAPGTTLGAADDPHLHLWHGLTLELGITVLAIAGGVGIALARHRITPWLERELLPLSGADVIERMAGALARRGRRVGDVVRTTSPTTHLVALFSVFIALSTAGVAAVATGAWSLPAPVANLSRPSDIIVLIIITAGTLGCVTATSRVGALVSLGAVGSGMLVAIFSLGAPDVGLTLLLVEILSVVVFMLVLRNLPRAFTPPEPQRRTLAIVIALAVGIATFLATWSLTGRRTLSPLARYYLEHGPEITTGDNVTNTIIVEFRAFDTFGELSVLAVTALAIAAVLVSVPRATRHTDTPTRSRSVDGVSRTVAHRDDALHPTSTAHVRPEVVNDLSIDPAILDPASNTLVFRLVFKVIVPVLAIGGVMIFWRGHNAPGGGFIASLILAAGLTLFYLSRRHEHALTRSSTPIVLALVGVLLATGTGIYGYLVPGHDTPGGFLNPDHWHLGSTHLASAMLFDGGILLAVIGMIIASLNYLGTGQAPYADPHEEPPAPGSTERTKPGDPDDVPKHHLDPNYDDLGNEGFTTLEQLKNAEDRGVHS